MFFSVSNAVSDSIVRTQFTATESCIIVIPARPNQGVAVNGIPTLDTSIQLELGDEITLDLTSPAEGAIDFYEWSYNNNPCFFAVTSRNNQRNRTIRPSVDDRAWWEFENPSEEIKYQGVNSDGILNYSIEIDDEARLPLPPGREDIVAFLEPSSNRIVFFYNIDGQTDGLLSVPNNFHTLELPSSPRSMARILNNANRRYDIYVLCEDGFIYRIDHQFQITQSSISHPDTAWVLVSDDINLWVAGDQYLVRLVDMNTLGQTIPTSEFITAGAATGPLVMFSAKGGKTLRVSGDQITIAHTGGWKGIPAVSNDRIWFPDPTQNRVIGYNARTAVVTSFQSVGAVSSLPWATGSNGEDLVISYLDETSIGFLPDGAPFASGRSLIEQVMFIGCSDNWIIGSTYLADLRFTNVNSPEVSGPQFGYREGPNASDVGSGDFIVSSENEFTPVRLASNIRAVIDGQFYPLGSAGATINIPDGGYLGISLRSDISQKSTAIVIGTQAFDYIVKGVESLSKTPIINPGVQPLGLVSGFTFEIPTMVMDAPISVSSGTITVNGQPHDGISRVNAGDEVVITLRLRTDSVNRSTILSLADSQFALIANGRVETELALEQNVSIGSTEIVSEVTVPVSGSYNVPLYSRDVRVSINGTELFPSNNSSPISLTQGDTISINHVRSSQILNDFRRTYIIGPEFNYYVESSSFVDDEPDVVDFGIIPLLNGFPRLLSIAPNTVTISGLSVGFPVRIFSDDPNVTFSVNGGEFEASPEVRNGDTVQAQYLVRNLFDSKSVFSERSGGEQFLLGTIGIESPDQTHFLSFNKVDSDPSVWDRFSYADSAYQSESLFGSTVSYQATDAPLGEVVSFDQMTTDAPSGDFQISGTESIAILPDNRFEFYRYSSDPLGREVLDRFENVQLDKDFYYQGQVSYQSSIDQLPYDPRNEWEGDQSGSSFERVWGMDQHETHQLFDPNFEFTSEIAPKMFLPNWSWLNENSRHTFSPTWYYLSGERRDIVDFVVFFEAFKDVFSVSFVDTVYQSGINSNYIGIVLEPTFVSASEYSDVETDSEFYRDGIKESVPLVGEFIPERLWDTNLPLLTGGFLDQISAESAAQFVAGSLTFETYQQPEGSWSFIVNRETSLFCPVQPTSLRAVAWLLGGG